MDAESSCQCSADALQIMAEFRSINTVIDLDAILSLVHRASWHWRAMVSCGNCRRAPQSPIVAVPALIEQCLSLFEAVCTTYDIAQRNALFDPAGLAFEQRLPQYICIKSRILLGQMELDDGESRCLIRILLNRDLVQILELLEVLKDILRARPEAATHAHRAGSSTLLACESPVESTIHRVASLIEQIETDSSKDMSPLACLVF